MLLSFEGTSLDANEAGITRLFGANNTGKTTTLEARPCRADRPFRTMRQYLE